jgi:ketosteroid isomerase-like protein
MSNKETVELYMEGFNQTDHAKILSCLADDVVWDMPGYFNLKGKKQFDKEIENDAFEGSPVITLTRLVEEGNIVVAEGAVKSKMKNGQLLDALFCDVFHFEKGKIKQLTSYMMHRKQP